VTKPDVEPTDSANTSTSLLERAVMGRPGAWERLVGLYGPLVYQWCRRWGLQPSDAEALGQEVFLRVFQRLQTHRRDRQEDSFRGWLYRIARNAFVDQIRRGDQPTTAAGGSDALEALHQIPAAAEAEPQKTGEEDALLYRRAVELIRTEISERDWQAFSQVVLAGRPPVDVAAELNVSPNVVYLAKSRILRRLQEEFADLIDF